MEYVSADSLLAQQALYDGEVRFIRVNGRLVDMEAEGRRRRAHRDCIESLDRTPCERPVLPDPRG